MRAALIERCQLDSNDPRAGPGPLNAIIMAALHRFQVANPHAWPWDTIETTYTATATAEKISTPIYVTTKVKYLIINEPGNATRWPLERMTRAAQLANYPSDLERRMPRTFSILGDGYQTPGVGAADASMAIWLRPIPDRTYTLTAGVVRPMPEPPTDADPGSQFYMIDAWIDCVIEYAAMLIYRSHSDLAEAVLGSKSVFDAEVMRLRRGVRGTAGYSAGPHTVADGMGAL